MDHLDFTSNASLKETKTTVVGRQHLHVSVDFFTVDISSKQPEHARLALDLGQQTGIRGDLVTDECGP